MAGNNQKPSSDRLDRIERTLKAMADQRHLIDHDFVRLERILRKLTRGRKGR